MPDRVLSSKSQRVAARILKVGNVAADQFDGVVLLALGDVQQGTL